MKNLGKVSVLFACMAWQSPGIAADKEGLEIELTPYAWLAGVDADVRAGVREAEIDQSFSDIVENVDAVFMGMAVASVHRLVLFGQYDYINLDTDGDTVDTELDTHIGTIAAGYRFGQKSTYDLMVGYRSIDLELDLEGASFEANGKVDIGDTIVMLRPSIPLSDKWRFNPTLAYAVDGDSRTHYELHPEFQYQVSDSFALRLGYRKLHYEVEEGPRNTPRNRQFDGDLSGILVGFGWTFPKAGAVPVTAEPAAAPAPAQAPAPQRMVAPPADGDNDGVPDASDACPSTPAGMRVDDRGCECDVSLQLHFAFDSAELTDADRSELDRVSGRLAEIGWVDGAAEGHSDSIGNTAYNLALSQRRAQAVVDYLVNNGVAADRVTVTGFGETQPVAENSTEEGRAQNRRVTLRRTNCTVN